MTHSFNIKLTIRIGLFLFLLLSNYSCSLFPETQKDKTANECIYEAFEEWYLWYDQLPDIDPNDFSTMEELVDALKVTQDRWSYAGSLTKVRKIFEEGEYSGVGGGFLLDYDDQIKISKVYTNSPLGRLGVQRGWIVNSVNGYGADNIAEVNNALASDGDIAFILTDLEGLQHQATVQKEVININTVLFSSIIEKEGHLIGYLVFDSFLEISEDELITEFQTFQNQGITDLIVDLRYNGGGLNDIANQLIGMIGGAKVAGQTIAKRVYNDKKSSQNTSEISDYIGPKININTVYFLTTSSTASASELVINCLAPFMEVKLVGSNTHGKPVGMLILPFEELDLAVLPICFKNVNHNDYGDYFEGITVDFLETDDLSHNWGDLDERMLSTALNDIIGNIAVSMAMKNAQIERQKVFEYSGIHQIINAY